ncbi:MAG: hypothetical protein LBD06_10485 [Candidatus Accumulibacter sp.]|nr:hypothetical protein [Accumulibacter sp.]
MRVFRALGKSVSEDSYLRGQKTEAFAALSRRVRKEKPSDGFFCLLSSPIPVL